MRGGPDRKGDRLQLRPALGGARLYGEANRWERYAARFAAKEAGMKALGTGWRAGLGWQDLEVANLPSGRPTLLLHRRAAEIAGRLGVRNVSLSLTHTAEQAMAVVILES